MAGDAIAPTGTLEHKKNVFFDKASKFIPVVKTS